MDLIFELLILPIKVIVGGCLWALIGAIITLIGVIIFAIKTKNRTVEYILKPSYKGKPIIIKGGKDAN